VLAAIVPAAGVEPNTFDAAAMTAQDQSALATLFAASIEIQGHVSAAQRASLSIALAAPADADANATKFFANVTTQLKEIGYTISPTPANAVVVLSLSNPGLQEGGYRADGLPQRRATVRGTMRWTYSGRIADLGTITGVGVDSDKHVLSEAALRAAAQQVARAVSSAVEGA
jgi:hypothetical protein